MSNYQAPLLSGFVLGRRWNLVVASLRVVKRRIRFQVPPTMEPNQPSPLNPAPEAQPQPSSVEGIIAQFMQMVESVRERHSRPE